MRKLKLMTVSVTILSIALLVGCTRKAQDDRVIQSIIDPNYNIADLALDSIVCKPRDMLVGTEASFINLNKGPSPDLVANFADPADEYIVTQTFNVNTYKLRVAGLDLFVAKSRQKLINSHLKKSAANKHPVTVNLKVRASNTAIKTVTGSIVPKAGTVARGYYKYTRKTFSGRPLAINRGPKGEVEVDMVVKGENYFVCTLVFKSPTQ